MTKPTVTIGVPVYNGATYLEQALHSLVTQDFDDLEIIIGDNGSTDGTEEIGRAFAARDRRVQYHRSDVNRGAAWNYNRLYDLSRGEFFKWSSHDDYLEPSYLTRCVGELRQFPEASIAFPQTRLVGAEGEFLRIHPDDWDLREPNVRRRFRHTINQHGLHNVVFGLMRSSALRTTRLIGRFDGSDIILLTEMTLRGQFHQIQEPLFNRRMHPQMSRRALKNPRDVAKWFDTSARAYYFTWTRLYSETMRAVSRAPISRSDKSWCWACTTYDWQWKRVGREWIQTGREMISKDAPDRYENFSEPVELSP